MKGGQDFHHSEQPTIVMQANPTEALQVLEQQEHAAMMQAEALLKVQEGLVNGRKWLWDEAARKLGTLLSSPAAFEGEHFLQVRTVTGGELPDRQVVFGFKVVLASVEAREDEGLHEWCSRG